MRKEKRELDSQEEERIKRLTYFRIQYIHKIQRKAADLLGTSQATLSDAESGRRQISLAILDKFYDKYKMNSEWFMYGIGPEIFDEPRQKDGTELISELAATFSILEKKIKMFEINQIKTFKLIESLEKRLKDANIK